MKLNPDLTKRESIEKWLADGQSWVGVFENHDMGYLVNVSCTAHRFGMPFDISQWDMAVLYKTSAPDTAQFGLGWRWLLVAKCKTVEEALPYFEKVEFQEVDD